MIGTQDVWRINEAQAEGTAFLKVPEQENFVIFWELKFLPPSGPSHILFSLPANTCPISCFTWQTSLLNKYLISNKHVLREAICEHHTNRILLWFFYQWRWATHYWVFYYSDILRNYRIFSLNLYITIGSFIEDLMYARQCAKSTCKLKLHLIFTIHLTGQYDL